MVDESKVSERLAMAVITERERVAAIEKVDVFSRFEKILRQSDIEKMFIRNYPQAVPGSLRCTGVSGKGQGHRGEIYSNLLMDDPSHARGTRTGSVITSIEASANGAHRVYAFVNIDG